MMSDRPSEFSFRTRSQSIQRFRDEVFDLLVIGGGITGAAVARDAVSRGLKVALVERCDFAFGTSSRSSKLIHGGLRYLQNFEIKLVFEALAERTLLLKTTPHLVRPLPFFLPSYRGDANSKGLLNLGLWLYDLLALFRSPGFHQSLSRKRLLENIPFLKTEGLRGGFRFYDASMWDDVMVIETLRWAQVNGAAVANYIEAIDPIWEENRISGFKVRDLEHSGGRSDSDRVLSVRARKTIVCAGPWTDQLGSKMDKNWSRWLTPSQGVHLVFDLKRIPLPGALMMSHSEDGRVAFVIPRTDYGSGVVIVGTTDGVADQDPDSARVGTNEVDYLLNLLNQYFPTLKLTQEDILSAYVGVRPLMGGETRPANAQGVKANESSESSVLQKVSREHHIDLGPGGTVVVAGGKYTTHRKMAEEIVDFALKHWGAGESGSGDLVSSKKIGSSKTKAPSNVRALAESVSQSRGEAMTLGLNLSEELWSRYGADAVEVARLRKPTQAMEADPEGFPDLEAQLRYCVQNEMVVHLEDFYLRRIPLYVARRDQGMPWAERLVKVWAEELNRSEKEAAVELDRLRSELEKRSSWRQTVRAALT